MGFGAALLLAAACASTNNESALTKTGSQPLSGEELEALFREPLLLSWEASDGYTVGATKATPDRDLLDFDITSSARVGFDHRSLRHALPSRLGKYVIVNNNLCIRYEERKRPVCVRFFKTGDKRFTAFLPDGRHYKSFKLQEP